jgi:HPt (histidine-containing phosphotransfer) domain-containing protein
MEMNADAIAQEPLLDRSVVDEFVDEIGARAAQGMFAICLVQTEQRLAVLRGLSCDDRGAIAFEAHSLIGSSGTFGMMRLARLAYELECRSATIAPDAYSEAVEQLLEAYRGSRHALVDYLEKITRVAAAI